MFICDRKEMEEKERQEAEFDKPEMRSVTNKDFNIDDFVPMQPAPTAVSII